MNFSSHVPEAPEASAGQKWSQEIPDSWEEDENQASDYIQEPESAEQGAESQNPPSAPGPSRPSAAACPAVTSSPPSSQPSDRSIETRPEKTDSVARRLIAGALGLKAPKQTAEQQAYQKAVCDKERRKKEEAKAMAQKQMDEVERARAAIWND